MVVDRPFLKLKIKPRNLGIKLSIMQSRTRRRYRNFVENIVNLAQTTMKSFVPVRTGLLRSSIMVISKSIQGGGIDLRSNASVGSTLNYASFVDQGTNPSQGAYIPFLGRRIHTGIHPGTPASNFIQRTKESIDGQLQIRGQNFMNQMRKELNRIK